MVYQNATFIGLGVRWRETEPKRTSRSGAHPPHGKGVAKRSLPEGGVISVIWQTCSLPYRKVGLQCVEKLMGSALWEKYFTFSLGGSQAKALEYLGGGLSSVHV